MRITYRETWGARYGRGAILTETPGQVIIHHWGSPHVAYDVPIATERALLRGVESHHVEVNGWSGIGYNWVVMPSGRVYEGRGWLRQGAHTPGWNDRSVGVAVAMDGEHNKPTDEAIGAIRYLIRVGIDGGALASHPGISGHRDHRATICPGKHLYRRIPELNVPEPEIRPPPLTVQVPKPEPVWRRLVERVRGWVGV
jgi:peptidoglycan recognition protein